MITSITSDNSSKFVELFTKAYNVLKERGKLSEELIEHYENNGGRLTSLEEYFSHIADLQEIDKAFLMLPSETPFDINADTRMMTIPANFKTYGVGVAGDQLAETLLFEIDRYFDYMDLASEGMQTYVQWELPDGTQGASMVEMKDIETKPGYILFGWTLTNNVTKMAGRIKFSVRFFKKNGEGKIVYSFNTLPHMVTLNDALQVEVQSDKEVDSASALFNSAIVNGSVTINGIPAEIPYFTSPAKDLTSPAFIDNNNQIVLTAQALANDAGNIHYEWHYLDGEGMEHKYQPTPSENDDEFIKAVYSYVALKDAEGNNIPVDREKPEYKHKNFYIYNETAPTGYEPYSGVYPQASNITLYEREVALTITANDEKSITGKYWVTAKNQAGLSSSPVVSSTHCVVPGPERLVFEEAIPSKVIIEGEAADINILVGIDLDKDYAKNTSIIYAWEKSISGDEGEYEAVETKYDPAFSVDYENIGWYKVKVTSTLNNDQKVINSDVCKITNAPVAPELSVECDTSKTPSTTVTEPEGENYININLPGIHELVTLNVSAAEINKANEDMSYELYSEGYEYNWYRILQDADINESDMIKVDRQNDSDIDPNNEDPASLTIIGSREVSQIFRCEVTNHLNGATAVARTKDFKIFA